MEEEKEEEERKLSCAAWMNNEWELGIESYNFNCAFLNLLGNLYLFNLKSLKQSDVFIAWSFSGISIIHVSVPGSVSSFLLFFYASVPTLWFFLV